MHLGKLAIFAFTVQAMPVMAQDPIVLATTADLGLAVYEAGGFDWDGFYAGVYGTASSDPANGAQYGAGLNLGFSRTFDFVLVGGEVALHVLGNDIVANSYLQAVGRGGVLVTDNLLVFGAAGVGTDIGARNDNHVLAGAGLELGVTESVSLRGQYLHGFPVSNDNPIEQVTLGAAFHF